MRYPKMLVRKVSIGTMPIQVTGGKDKATTKPAGKRSISVYKRNTNGADESYGDFASYQAFADSKGINTGTDSARRVIEADGYYGVAAS